MVNTARRNFFRGLPADTPAPVRPPHAVSEALFTDRCTRCEDCLDQCPESIIVRGSGGLPEVNFNLGACTFCGACVDACTTDALTTAIQPAWQLRLVVEDSCLAHNRVLCQTCRDVCDVSAITFTPRAGEVPVPLVDQEACTGCGACIGACPSNALRLEPVAPTRPAQEKRGQHV